MAETNPVRKLLDSSPNLELWWDSSPLVYKEWIEEAGEGYGEMGLFQVNNERTGARFLGDSLLQGSTTNQPLTWRVIERDPERWRAWLERELDESPGVEVQEAMWRLFIQVAVQGAEMLEPIFRASQFKRGQICCQVDPRNMTDLDAMLNQARRIHAARPNIMVKMPGTKEGIEGVHILTREGIPTNVTMGYTVSQLVAVGEATEKGLAEAKALGTDLSYWRSCAVMMLGRYEDAPPLKAQAAEQGIELSEADMRWAGIAIFRKAHRLYREWRYPSKLMAASMRLGPTIDGVQHIWHMEKLAGANAVLTVFPNIFETFLSAYRDVPIKPQIEEPIPGDVLERLLRIPYFADAYDEKGIIPENFVEHPALQATAAGFSEAMEKVEQFTARALATLKG